jgi:hypothetical protein
VAPPEKLRVRVGSRVWSQFSRHFPRALLLKSSHETEERLSTARAFLLALCSKPKLAKMNLPEGSNAFQIPHDR